MAARSAGSKIPENVQWLNTHRHQGIDIFVLTQGPKLLDQNLRTLVKRHYHIAVNKMGLRTLLEWKVCADDPVKWHQVHFPVSTHWIKVYDLYESAEIHTVNKVKRSKWFIRARHHIIDSAICRFVLQNVGQLRKNRKNPQHKNRRQQNSRQYFRIKQKENR